MVSITVAGEGCFRLSLPGHATVEQAVALLLGDWSGNYLASAGSQHFERHDTVQGVLSCGAFVVTNFSSLRTGQKELQAIPKTEDRGIRISQLELLLGFVQQRVGCWCETSSRGTVPQGQPLTIEMFNLYHASSWVIVPSTKGLNGAGCSFVELLTEEAAQQKLSWFVSHAWKEPIYRFIAVVRKHAAIRLLDDGCYWICAYANNQHNLADEIPENPRKSAFYFALQECRGIILVLDEDATPFSRAWCIFEESVAIEQQQALSMKTERLLLDVGASDAMGHAHLITDGLAGEELDMLPVLAWHSKARREAPFPLEILRHGLQVDIVNKAEASKPEDKRRILGSIAFPRADTAALPHLQDVRRFAEVNGGLKSHFALASWYGHLAQGRDLSEAARALRADALRRIVQLSFAGLRRFSEGHLHGLASHLPCNLEVLDLDVSFTALRSLDALHALAALPLKRLALRCIGAELRCAIGLALGLAHARILRLELWLVSLAGLEQLGELSLTLQSLETLEELVLSVNECPNLAKEQKMELWQAARSLKRRRGHALESWVSMKDCEQPWLEWCGLVAPAEHGDLLADEAASKSSETSVMGHSFDDSSSETSESSDDQALELPYPCSYPGCRHFHDDPSGYCGRHCCLCLLRIGCKLAEGLTTAWRLAELVLLFLTQAAMEMESRAMLALLLLSLLPVVCYSLSQAVGIPTMLIAAVLLAAAAASAAYTVYRFDRMHRAAMELELAAEASYVEVLKAEGAADSTQVFSIFSGLDETKHVSPPLDLRSRYLRAKQSLPLFERDVCLPIAHLLGDSNVKPRLLPLCSTRPEEEGVLCCDVCCANLQQVKAVWELLQPRAVAVQDGFASQRGPREALVQLQGATVRLRLAPLQRLQQRLDTVHHWAEALGLLQITGHAKVATRRRCSVAVAVTALRLVTLLAAAYLAAQYFFRYGPQQHLPTQLEQLLVLNATGNDTLDVGDNSWWLGGLYALPYAVLVGLLAFDVFRRPHAMRKNTTQMVYERFFGIRGSYYTWKVAILQLLTVALQAMGKLKLLSAIVSVAIFLKSDAVLQLQVGFWAFVSLLLANAIYPSILILFPHSSTRFAAASMDAFLDLGYTVTYLAVVLTALPELSFQESVSGNFDWGMGKEKDNLQISDRLTPSFAFPSGPLSFVAVYMSLAHVLAVCRAVERADRDRETQGEQPPGPVSTLHGKFKEGKRHLVLAVCSSMLPLLVLTCVWLGVSYPLMQPKDFRCFPCNCDASSNATMRLVACALPQTLRYSELSMSDHDIVEIEPNSLPTSLKLLSLSNNPLRNLDGALFSQLASLEVLDLGNMSLETLHPEAFLGLVGLRLLSLSQNKLAQLPERLLEPVPKLEKLFLGGKTDEHWQVFMEGNLLETFPVGFFAHTPDLRILDVSENKLQAWTKASGTLRKLEVLDLQNNAITQLPADAFHGLPALQLLGLHNNTLSELPSQIFAGRIALRDVDLSNNMLSELPAEVFHGLRSLQKLHLYNNTLVELPAKIFHGLTSLQKLSLNNNTLSELPAEIFHGLRSLRTLYIYNNKLAELPVGIFQGLLALQKLYIRNNRLAKLPAQIFQGLPALQKLTMSKNMLSELPVGIFQGVPALQALSIGKNMLSELPAEIFHGLGSLQELHIYKNKLAGLPVGIFQHLPALRLLSLHNNMLAELPAEIFHGLPALQELYIYNNQLAELPAQVFHGLRALQRLDLRWNPLWKLPADIFQGLTSLQELYMDKNKLAELPGICNRGVSCPD